MIHEIFSPIEDPQLATACSEIFTGEYRYLQDEEEKDLYGAGSELLLNPDIELLTLQASYLEEAPDGHLQNPVMFASFGPQLPPLERLLAVYTDSIGKIQGWLNQDVIRIALSFKQFEGGWPTIKAWYGDEVAKKGRSLLSAYFLGRVAGDNSMLVETLVYPEHIRQTLRLLIRDGFIAALPEVSPDIQANMRDELLDNERVYSVVSDVCASNLLLFPKDLKRFLEPFEQGLTAD